MHGQHGWGAQPVQGPKSLQPKSLVLSPGSWSNVPNILPRLKSRALEKRFPMVRSEKTWHLSSLLRKQAECRELCFESCPKSIDYRIKNLRLLLFFPFYTEKVYDSLLFHSIHGPEGALLEGISASGHSQASPPPTACDV